MLETGEIMKIIKIETLDTVDSTSTQLKKNRDNLESGLLLRAIKQTAGRGRNGKSWHANEDKNLTFSFYLKEKESMPYQLLMATSLSVIETLNDYHIEASIKLPNDIIVNHKKIAGILIEVSHLKNQSSVIVGVGINVNETNPKYYSENATSMIKHTNKPVNQDQLLKTFVKHFNYFVSNKLLFEAFYQKLRLNQDTVLFESESYCFKDITNQFECTIYNQIETKIVPCESIKFIYN